MSTVSPFAPKSYPTLPPVGGVRIATAAAGVRYKDRTDVLLAVLEPGTTVGGVTTRSKCPSAPVEWCREGLKRGMARALVVNSGNANAFTGGRGRAAAEATARTAASVLGCDPGEVFLASTGVIGEPLPADRITAVLAELAERAAPDPGGPGAPFWVDAARAIMTTDTYPKVAGASSEIGGAGIALAGIAKGAGMIAPDMATMLSFLFTDAPIDAPVLQALVAEGAGDSFNAITVDSDTSTSDTVLLFATGKAEAPRITDASDPRLSAFRADLFRVMRDLSHQVVKDGEGARKFVEITVTGAVDRPSARRIAFSVANSPLVKTAIAGEDANWGRIVMAVGKAGEPADRDRLSIWFGEIRVAHEGLRDPAYSEEAVSAYMRRAEIAIRIDLGLGDGRDTVWTCDLTKDYVAINGDYRS